MAANQVKLQMFKFLAVVLFLLLLIFGVFLIYPARIQYERQREFYALLKAEADQKRAERDALAREVAALESSPAAIEKVARVNFRLCKEGEIVMYYREPGANRRPGQNDQPTR
mgnify:CR=1 FL=1